MAVLDVVHGVAQNSLRVSLAENSFIDSGLRSSGNHQIRTFKVRRGKLLRSPFHFSLRDPLPDGWRHLRRDNANARLGCKKALNLPFRDGTATDNHNQAIAKLHENGQQARSEEHTSELQSRQYLVCRLLLEKKKN